MRSFPILLPGRDERAPGLIAAMQWLRWVGGPPLETAPIVVADPPDWPAYAHRGGRGRPPQNSQELVGSLLAGLAADERERLAAAGRDPLVIVPDGAGYAPHTWRLRRGGVPLGGRRWARRYAIVPAGASLGTYAHELGHLLFGWPDADRRRRVGAECLMGSGGHHPPGGEPAPPCAPLRVDAGWVEPQPARRATTPADLAGGAVFRAAGRDGQSVLVEGRPLAGRAGTVLAFADGMPPRLVTRIPLRDGDEDRPLLALLRAATLPATAPAR